jgi:N-acetylglucosamine-6-phosphate deacetylase
MDLLLPHNQSNMIAYTNGTIYTGNTIEQEKAILVKDDTVLDIVPDADIPENFFRKNLRGKNIAPALIDLQIYGGNGKLFSQDTSIEALQATYQYCLSGGAANFMITLATNSIERFLLAIEQVKRYWQEGGKGLLGLHLEGPYINPIKRGAHTAHYIKKPTLEEVKQLLNRGKGVIKMMTLAPEICSNDIIELLSDNGVIISAGHSNASYEQAMQAFDKNIPVATHLFNAMSPLHHREPGMVGAIFDHPGVNCSLVADGIHVNFAAIRVSKKIMGERLFFITDAVTEVVAGEYQHLFRGDHYSLPDGTLSGSALTMMQSVKNGVEKVGIDIAEALRMASLYPARVINKQHELGKIAKGSIASFLIFDDRFAVSEVIVV